MQPDTHKIDYVQLPEPGKLLAIQPLDYHNPYDYTRLHRHDYFEVILVEGGSGNQLVDFVNYPMQQGNIFVIYPGQVHLMNRNTTQGMVLQFRKNIFEYIHPLKHHQFFNRSAEVVCSADIFTHLYDLAVRTQQLLQPDHPLSLTHHKAYSYLQIILISLLETHGQKAVGSKESLLLSQFISLLTDNIKDKKKVSEYADMMNCTADKINDACKKVLDKTALEIIHEELLLEIRRLLLLNELSLKEVAYELNFDTQGNFNAFVKSKTGLTPKELQSSVLEIYN